MQQCGAGRWGGRQQAHLLVLLLDDLGHEAASLPLSSRGREARR